MKAFREVVLIVVELTPTLDLPHQDASVHPDKAEKVGAVVESVICQKHCTGVGKVAVQEAAPVTAEETTATVNLVASGATASVTVMIGVAVLRTAPATPRLV